MNNFDLLIFTQHPLAYAPNRLVVEASKLGFKPIVISYSSLNINNFINLPSAKYVILREPDTNKNLYTLRDNILKHYFSQGSVVLNSQSYLKWSVLDKLTQHQEFGKSNIPYIKPVSINNLNFPSIVKAKLGSHGSHVFKIDNKKDLEIVFSKGYKKEDLLAQEFQSSGFDLRVIVLGGKVLGVMKRTPKPGNFLSNYSRGGSVEKYKGNNIKIIKNMALLTAKHFKLNYVGVDVILGNDGVWKVLEVNRGCQFKGFEEAIKVNVAQSIIKFLT